MNGKQCRPVSCTFFPFFVVNIMSLDEYFANTLQYLEFSLYMYVLRMPHSIVQSVVYLTADPGI